MNDFEKLMHLFEKEYYGGPIMAFFEIVAIITGLLLVRKDKTGVAFLIYLIFDFLVLVSYYPIKLSGSTNPKTISFLTSFFNAIIYCLEFLVYYYFFFKVIRNKAIIRLMKFLWIIFIIIIVVFIITEFSFLTNRYFYVSDMIGTTEFLFLLIPCFFYYFELLKNNPVINLYQRPSFWIVTGIFFYAVISIPFYLINGFVSSNHPEYYYSISLFFFFVPFTINFIFLTRAFLCKKTLTT